jgi:hypothetical protein
MLKRRVEDPMSLKIKLVHKLIRPVVKNLERLPLSKKERINKIFDQILFLRNLSEKKRLNSLLFDNNSNLFLIPRDKGFVRFSVDKNFTESAINFGRITLQKHLNQNSLKSNSKDYLKQIFNSSKLNRESEFLFDWATSPSVLKSVASYLNKFPLLHDISVFYSPPENKEVREFSGSQLFHMDGGGTQCVKLWLLCEEVGLENGPTVLIPAELSQGIASKINYQPGTKISDEIVGSYESTAFYATGPAGSWFATDTDRCFHYGSRTLESSGRLVLMFHYVDHNSTYYAPLLSQHYKTSTNLISAEIYKRKSRFANESIRFRKL